MPQVCQCSSRRGSGAPLSLSLSSPPPERQNARTPGHTRTPRLVYSSAGLRQNAIANAAITVFASLPFLSLTRTHTHSLSHAFFFSLSLVEAETFSSLRSPSFIPSPFPISISISPSPFTSSSFLLLHLLSSTSPSFLWDPIWSSHFRLSATNLPFPPSTWQRPSVIVCDPRTSNCGRTYHDLIRNHILIFPAPRCVSPKLNRRETRQTRTGHLFFFLCGGGDRSIALSRGGGSNIDGETQLACDGIRRWLQWRV
jgi:hypothetical protein